ncbi:MAG: hypothetical protein M1546_10360 [Chloroflexi bacterium]|nr:hypothetical protein [Chloroflexota bacterium]
MLTMKTTIDIPDELFREAKARAALEGMKLRDLVAEALREKLHAPRPKAQRRRTKFPIIHSRRTDAPVTLEQVNRAIEALDTEEAQRHAGIM